MISKKDFLEEHNRLAPAHLQVTVAMLSRFRAEKPSLFKGSGWPIDKIRRPFIIWLTSLTSKEKDDMKNGSTVS